MADAATVHHWSAERVSDLVTDVLRDVGADEATVAAVRVGFAREAIDGWAVTRLGQQELSQRFGLPFGLSLRLSSVLSYLSAASVRIQQSEPSPVADTTACGEAEAVTSSIAASDADVKIEPPTDAATDVKSVPDCMPLVDGAEPQPPSADSNTTSPRPATPSEIPAGQPSTESHNHKLVDNESTHGGERELMPQQSSPVPITSN